MTKDSVINVKLEGTFLSLAMREFLTNSAYFPMSNLILEALQEGMGKYFTEPDPYILLFAAIAQSIGLTFIRLKNWRFKFWGNFIGPAIYVALEAPLEGTNFFSAPQHQAYWYFSIIIAFLQLIKNETNSPNRINLFEVLENIVRTLIPLCMYMLIEAEGSNFLLNIPKFFNDPAHVFLSIVLFLLGVLIGFSEANNSLAKIQMKLLAKQLRNYSSWSLGKNILNAAVMDENIFKIKRVERAIVFLDIRGFTKWSEKETPENVVKMLNSYYLEAEGLLSKYTILKTKYTADEIMLVFENIDQAASSALILRDHLNKMLKNFNLTVGGGLHFGTVVEGLIGSLDHKLYDVMGDTVNTAKRLCETAKGEEILVSKEFIDQTEGRAFITESREVTLKGKEKTYEVFPLKNYFSS